ncbi:MAG: SRPBCC family protein [Bdellovibrionota bacterium]
MSTEQPKIIVSRSFARPPTDVFAAWVTPELISRWMFGPKVREEEIVSLTVDHFVGGEFSFVVRRQGQELDHAGRYLEINEPHRLRFTWGVRNISKDESEVIVEIGARESGSELTLTHLIHPAWIEFSEKTKEGWSKMLDHLEPALEQYFLQG